MCHDGLLKTAATGNALISLLGRYGSVVGRVSREEDGPAAAAAGT